MEPTKQNTTILMRNFMTDWFDSLSQEQQVAAWQELNAIVDSAKLEIVEDAEKAISKLRVFSL